METDGSLAAVLVALGISTVNTAVGVVVAKNAFGRDLNTFLAMVFASLGVRAIAVIAAAWYCLSVAGFHQLAFSITFAIAGFVFLMGEILFFHQSYEKSKGRVRRPVSQLLKKKIDFKGLVAAIAALPVEYLSSMHENRQYSYTH